MNNINDPIHFLLVDDLEENLHSLEALLRRDGLSLLKARSGTEALELLLKYDVALALLDVQMPGMDGFELAELMRGNLRTKFVPIIFLTAGSADWQRRFRGYEAGAVDFLQKPIEADILRSKAQVFYDLYRQQRELSCQRDRLKATSEENARLLEESIKYSGALKDADRRKDEFLATLAHELRNPLAPIRNGLQIMRLNHDTDVIENVRSMMDRQMNHLVRLIDDLLDVSRVSQGKIELKREKITVKSVVESAVEASQPFVEERSHTLEINLPDEILWIDADLTRVAQIINNLINNAAKYTPDGGHIVLRATKEDGWISISVADNGLGIPEDMLPKVFELFTQVDRNLERSQGGLGIGLALVRRLAEMHGGSIIAESAGLGKGSTFTVRLPLAMPKVEETPVALTGDQEPEAPPRSLNILVVDDNLDAAKTTGWMLEMIGHVPTLAHDGPGALSAARELNPEVIMLDIGLPGMNGYDVCRALRKEVQFKNTLFIAQTGWGQERDRKEAEAAGFHYHLVKPVGLDDISNLLTDALKTLNSN